MKDAAIDSDFQAVVEDRLLDLGTIFGFEDFLCGWFRGAPFEKIKRGNLLDFIAYGFYCKRVEDLTPEVWKNMLLALDISIQHTLLYSLWRCSIFTREVFCVEHTCLLEIVSKTILSAPCGSFRLDPC